MTNAIEAKSAAQADVPKLFYVTSTGIVNGYHNVPIDWFAVRGFDELGPDLPWAAIIESYDPNDPYHWRTKDRVAEMFTEDEAEALVQYLERTDPDGAPFVEPVKLPIPWSMPTEEWAAVTDNRIIFPLDPDNGYSLSFPVKGYCRIAGRPLMREKNSGAFVVYMDGTPVSTPFADREKAEEWMSHLLGEQLRG
jgi:hypothetical protein